MADPFEVGQRVAQYRRRRGLSQGQLAKLVGRSVGWVGSVERGLYRLERLDMVTRVAGALDVSVGDLRPETKTPARRPNAAAEDPTGLVAVLATRPIVDRRTSGTDIDLRALEARVAGLTALAADRELLVAELVNVVPLADQVMASHPTDQSAYKSSCKAYELAAEVLVAVGDHAGAWVASDRAIRAAEHSGDRAEAAGAGLRAAQLFGTAGRWIHARAGARSVLAGLEPITTDTTPGCLSIAGTAHLVLADAAAHQSNRGRAAYRLDQAAALAVHVGPGQDLLGTGFGPLTVDCYRVGVAVTLKDAGVALNLAEKIDTNHLSPGRHARLCLDLALAELLRQSARPALRWLSKASELDPDLIAHDPTAWAAIDDLGGASSRNGIHLDRLRAQTQRP